MTERGDHPEPSGPPTPAPLPEPPQPEQQERPAPAPPPTPPPTAVGTLPPPPPWPPSPPATPSWQGPLATGYVGFAGLIIVAIGSLAQATTWFFDQVALIEDGSPPWWPVTGWLSGVAAALFALPILFFPRRMTALRAAGRAWLLGALLLAVLGTVRAIPYQHNELYLAVLGAATGGIALAVRLIRPGNRPAPQVRQPDGSVTAEMVPEPVRRPWPTDAVWLGVAAGLATLIPWLWLASLGGLLETVLAALAAAGVGALCGTVLGSGFWRPYGELPRWRLVLGGGYVAGVALLLLTASVGGSGVQVAGMLVIPALGYAAAALQRDMTVSGAPVGAMVAVATFGPLAFIDPEEMSILLGFTDVLGWAMLAALIALAVALLGGLVYGLLLRRVVLHAWLAALVALVVAMGGAVTYAAAGHPGLHGDRIFVVLKSQASLAGLPDHTGPERRGERIAAVYRHLVRHAQRTQRPLRGELDRLGLDHTPYYLVNGIAVNAGAAVREWLSHHEAVDRVLLDPVLRPIPRMPAGQEATEPFAPDSPRWNLTTVGAPLIWEEFDTTGEGIVVGSSDSGVDGSHPALRDGFRGGSDSWLDPWNDTRAPTDFGGHGTHTVGSAVGDENIGVAPGATWIGCVNLARNMASPSLYLTCMQFMLAPYARGEDPFRDGDPDRAPHVLNNSWGCPALEGCDAASLEPAISAFRAAGIFFVAAAGNTGPGCGTVNDPPARYDGAFAVAAVGEAGEVASFSSRGRRGGGPAPDIAAPGAGVLSAVPGGGYATLSGTSMASPHVAGAVALLWSVEPSLIGDIAGTEKLLRDTAQPATREGSCGAAAESGAGIIDAYAAARAAQDA